MAVEIAQKKKRKNRHGEIAVGRLQERGSSSPASLTLALALSLVSRGTLDSLTSTENKYFQGNSKRGADNKLRR